MVTPSPLTSLAATLAEMAERDRQQIEAQMSEQLKMHAESLRQLSNAALSTTKCVIEARHRAMVKSLAASNAQIETQQIALETGIRVQTKRLFWLMKVPILALLAVCLTICGGTWAFWKMASPWTEMEMSNGKNYLVLQGTWSTCKTPDGQQPCRPKN
ncbi:MAG: hypothetical protein PHU46_06555 [Rhodocyclaceae bacterium]|nr:hypothetical protein [Rhodocyclaceae bacterium]